MAIPPQNKYERRIKPRLIGRWRMFKGITKSIEYLSRTRDTYIVFNDLMAVMAIGISNAVDGIHREERGKQYANVAKGYSPEELNVFSQVFSMLVDELERHTPYPKDVLGDMFHQLELYNKYRGQYFTPDDVARMMGKMMFGGELPEKGYVSLNEPCIGSGTMILGFANAMTDAGLDYTTQMVVYGTDVDLKCVHMAYVQLSLYGIPAVITHGDTLSLKTWSRWYTPIYLLNNWIWKMPCECATDEMFRRASEPMYAAFKRMEELINAE